MLVSVASGDSWYTVITNQQCVVTGVGQTVTAHPHTLGPNEYSSNSSFPTNAFKYWKKAGNDWVGMTASEQAAVDDAEKAGKADFDGWDNEQMKALCKVLLDEINVLRQKAGLPQRTAEQMKTAIKSKL